MNLTAKTATDAGGNKIQVGDRVLCYSRYDNQPKNETTVLKIVRQGIDGTILHLDGPADLEFPHHRQCIAKDTVRIK